MDIGDPAVLDIERLRQFGFAVIRLGVKSGIVRFRKPI